MIKTRKLIVQWKGFTKVLGSYRLSLRQNKMFVPSSTIFRPPRPTERTEECWTFVTLSEFGVPVRFLLSVVIGSWGSWTLRVRLWVRGRSEGPAHTKPLPLPRRREEGSVSGSPRSGRTRWSRTWVRTA